MEPSGTMLCLHKGWLPFLCPYNLISPFLRQSFGERSEYDLTLENPLGRGRPKLRNWSQNFASWTLIKPLNQHKQIKVKQERLIGITSGITLIQFGRASLDLLLQLLVTFYSALLIMVYWGNFWVLFCVLNSKYNIKYSNKTTSAMFDDVCIAWTCASCDFVCGLSQWGKAL